MQYAERLPSTRTMMVPVLALALGAAAATGAYALLDGEPVIEPDTRVIVAETPAAPSNGVGTKNEAGTAAAIATSASSAQFVGKNEAGTAAAIATPSASGPVEGKNEAGTAAAIAPSSGSDRFAGKNEAGTAAAIGGGSNSGP